MTHKFNSLTTRSTPKETGTKSRAVKCTKRHFSSGQQCVMWAAGQRVGQEDARRLSRWRRHLLKNLGVFGPSLRLVATWSLAVVRKAPLKELANDGTTNLMCAHTSTLPTLWQPLSYNRISRSTSAISSGGTSWGIFSRFSHCYHTITRQSNAFSHST